MNSSFPMAVGEMELVGGSGGSGGEGNGGFGGGDGALGGGEAGCGGTVLPISNLIPESEIQP
jgi:hypothetical protein